MALQNLFFLISIPWTLEIPKLVGRVRLNHIAAPIGADSVP